jgi:surface carbohydrate biosynthesis protein
MKKILMFSHNPMRDMMFDSMLENDLRVKGNMVWNRPFLKNDFEAICTIKPDVIVLPEIRVEYSLTMAKQFKAWGGKVIVRMCEMGVTQKALPEITQEYREAIYGHFETDSIVDRVILFGEAQKALYCKYSGVSDEKVVAVGAMPFDPYFTPLPPRHERNKPVMLFATGFSYADRNTEYALPEGRVGQKLHVDKVQACRVNRAKWLQAIPALHSIYGRDYRFIVRPHAGEKQECYKEILKHCATVSTSGTGILTLHESDILIHAGSTMGIEAHITNKPGICMNPVSQDPVVKRLHPDGSTVEGFVEAMSKITLGKSNANPQAAEELSTYYAPIDGKAHLRAAEAIDAVEIQPTKIPDEWPKMKEALYTDDSDIIIACAQWHCAGCKNVYWVKDMNREMVKCPYCGIANVRLAKIPPGVQQ